MVGETENASHTEKLTSPMSRAIGEHIYHPAGTHAALRNTIMRAKSDNDWYNTLAWLYDGPGASKQQTAARAHPASGSATAPSAKCEFGLIANLFLLCGLA